MDWSHLLPDYKPHTGSSSAYVPPYHSSQLGNMKRTDSADSTDSAYSGYSAHSSGSGISYTSTVSYSADHPLSPLTPAEDTSWSPAANICSPSEDSLGSAGTIKPEAIDSAPQILTRIEAAASAVPHPSPGYKPAYICMAPHCSQKPFARSADLDRHYQRIHGAQQEGFYCDYVRCQRSQGPLYRKDHYRYHLREFHMEDLFRRNGQEDDGWVSSRYLNTEWWRCTKCLVRVSIRSDGFVCPSCNVPCEVERRRVRETREVERKTGAGRSSASLSP